MGEEPDVDRYSLAAIDTAKEPATSPTISGLIYCTTAAVWNFAAPAISRIKQAIQNAIFPGLPIKASTAATSPNNPPQTNNITFPSHFLSIFFLHSLYFSKNNAFNKQAGMTILGLWS